MMDKQGSGIGGKKKKKGMSLLDTPLGGEAARRTSETIYERRGTFFGDRRVSVAESARRASLLERTRRLSLQMRNRARITAEQRYNEAYLGVYTIRFSPDGESLAVGFGSGAIQVRYPDSGEVKATLRSGMEQSLAVMCIRFHPTRPHIFFAASTDGFIYICDAIQFNFSRYAEEKNNEINTLDISLSGEILASAGKDAAIRIYDTETGKMTSVYQNPLGDFNSNELLKFHRKRIYAVRFHPNQREIFVSGGWDDIVKIWDLRVQNGCVRNIQGPHICGESIDLKENVVVTGSWVIASSIQIWDLTTTKLIENIWPSNRMSTMEGEYLYALQYFDGDPYGETICVGGSGTGSLEVISLQEKRVNGTYQTNKPVQALDTQGNNIAFGGMDQILHLGEYY